MINRSNDNKFTVEREGSVADSVPSVGVKGACPTLKRATIENVVGHSNDSTKEKNRNFHSNKTHKIQQAALGRVLSALPIVKSGLMRSDIYVSCNKKMYTFTSF